MLTSQTTRCLALAVLLLAGGAGAQQPQERYKGREIAGVMSYRGAPWLERAERVREENPAQLLASLPLAEGATAVDMGCGSGYYARRMSQRVGEKGKVLCVDIQPEMLQIAGQLAERMGIENIEPVLGTATDPKLPEESIDLILLVDVYHEFSDPKAMLEAMRRALKPDGIAALAEYRLEGDSAAFIKVEHRMSIKQVMKEWRPAGFELVERIDDLPTQHLFLFRKKPD
ncbi:MAG: class I SAM-dependent methyltransferase [Acidobacteriota bacterium]